MGRKKGQGATTNIRKAFPQPRFVGVTGFSATPIYNIGAGRRMRLRLRTSNEVVRVIVGVTGFSAKGGCASGAEPAAL